MHYPVKGATCCLKPVTAPRRNADGWEGGGEIFREQLVHGCHCLANAM